MRIFELEETDSTNSWVARHRDMLPMPVFVFARRQTAGRGQRGNSWESEPEKNLCCSIFLHPEGVAPRRQFVVSEAVALAVTDLLEDYGVAATVKWPNDIYVDNRKISGILIEHAVTPREILYTIAGIGVNLNQKVFVSDAPNPVSLAQITGCQYDVTEAAALLADKVEKRMETAVASPEKLHEEFMTRLWRGDGKSYPFLDRLRGERIEARIAGVAPDGMITLDLGDETRVYAFKEIEFLLNV